MRIFIKSVFVTILFFFFVSPSFAHVVVKPPQVGTAAFQTFDMGVPTEKDTPTIGLKLVIPSGLKYVTPNVKAGWDINIVKNGDRVTEIEWNNGSIPSGQRDDFIFSAQVPANETTLKWKAYQTYQDGSIVAWDQDPDTLKAERNKGGEGKPFSTTKVVGDIAPSTNLNRVEDEYKKIWFVLGPGVIAIVISLYALSLVVHRKK